MDWDALRFDWDDDNRGHLARHGVAPDEAEQAIRDSFAMLLEIQQPPGRGMDEERSKIAGMTKSGRILIVVFTYRGPLLPPVTAYEAVPRDAEIYLKGRGA